MIHRFNATYDVNGQKQKTEMTYDDADIRSTLRRRLQTAFPNATNINIERVPEEQLSLNTREKK